MAVVQTSYHHLLGWAEKTPDRAFLNQPRNGQVETYSWKQAADNSRKMAGALRALGLRPGDKVAIIAKNSAEWFIADCAIIMAGLISVPIYPTAEAKTIRYVMEHSEAKAIFIGLLDNWQEPGKALDDSIIKIAFPYQSIDCDYQWLDLLEKHEPLAELSQPDSSDVMSILYTSGSTGKPKGVILSFGAYEYSCMTCASLLEFNENDRALSYLPLAHITERAVVEGPAIIAGVEIFFSESTATFLTDLKRARVTLFISVPRLWVKFQAGILAKISPLKLRILLAIPFVGKAVAKKIRDDLGLGYARLTGSGSAPISPLTLKWYQRIGIEIGEGWGMTETTGLSCNNSPFSVERIGTIGKPIPGTEMKLSEQGEILLRSPALMTEYYKEPELTKAAFTEDGFLRTGDKGEWDEACQAFRITGRVKDLFKSAKGKYVTPVPIESKLSASPLLEQICVMGSGLPAPVAVVVLSPIGESMAKDKIVDSLEETLSQVNAALESHERLSAIIIANEPWTIENELLTPTMKLKRDKLEEKYQAVISKPFASKIVWQ